MGGSAFPNHFIPRMSHATYSDLLSKNQEILTHFYAHVRVPPEGPSKQDHGDVDFIVATPLYAFKAEELQRALGAVARTRIGVTISFCVPLPTPTATIATTATSSPSSATPAPGEQEGAEGAEESFAQIDVHEVRDAAMLDWEVFLASYGDMQQILGLLQRPVGLTSNDKGMHVRVPEIEERNRKAAMIFLTCEVHEMLRFLGLDVRKWESGFESNEDVFEWCLKGRFWGEKVVTDVLAGRHRMKEDGMGMHSGDRLRMKKRPMFRACVEDFIPQRQDLWVGKRDWERMEVLEEALNHFGVKTEYEKMMEEHMTARREKALLEELKRAVAEEGDGLGVVMKGLKRWVRWENGRPIMCDEEEEIGDKPKWLAKVQDEDKDALLEWLTENHQELRRREKERAGRMRRGRETAKANP